MIRTIGLGLFLSNALAGCAFMKEATTYRPPMTPQEMKVEADAFQLPKLPDAGKALVYVVRPSGLGMLIRFNVFVDNHAPSSEMGYTRGSQHIYFQVLPGSHTIYSKAENWAEVRISPAAGDVVFVNQSPEMGLLIARNYMSVIDETQGKYDVKRTGLGTIIKPEHLDRASEAVLTENEVAKPDWRSLPADANMKIYSKVGNYTGQFISFDGDYLWIALDGGGRKALDSSQIDKVTVFQSK